MNDSLTIFFPPDAKGILRDFADFRQLVAIFYPLTYLVVEVLSIDCQRRVFFKPIVGSQF